MKGNKDMATQSEISPMMTPREVARLLSIHVNTVRRWSNEGLLIPYRIGKRGDRRFMREDINRFRYELNKNNGDERKVKLSW